MFYFKVNKMFSMMNIVSLFSLCRINLFEVEERKTGCTPDSNCTLVNPSSRVYEIRDCDLEM